MRFVLFLIAACVLAQDQPSPVRIEGRAVDTEGKPVPRAQVIVGSASGQVQAMSADDGSFALDVPPASNIAIRAQKAGYVSATYGGARLRLSLEAGEVLSGVLLQLAAQAVISGRITDQSGDPVGGIQVRIMSPRYMLGQREDVTFGITRTDDRGSYRLSGLPAGRFFVVAGGGVPISLRQQRAAEVDFDTYFGGTPSRKKATPIIATPGKEVQANIVLLRMPVFAIRGEIRTLEGPLRGSPLVAATQVEDAVSSRAIVRDGKFEVTRLLPGTYVLRLPRTMSDTGPTQTWRGMMRVTMAADVDHLTLVVGPGATIRGSVHLEGGELQVSADIPQQDDFSFIGQDMVSRGSGRRPIVGVVGEDLSIAALAQDPMPAVIRANGSFEIHGAEDSSYRLAIGGLPEGVYLKQVKQGGVDVTHTTINAGEPLDVLLSFGGATVISTLPALGLSAVLWPATPDGGNALRGVRMTASGTKGAVKLTGLPPGQYHIAAFDAEETGILWNYQFLSKFTANAATITLTEGAKATVKIPLIPAARFNEEFAKMQ